MARAGGMHNREALAWDIELIGTTCATEALNAVKTAIKNEKFNGTFIYKNINKNKPGH